MIRLKAISFVLITLLLVQARSNGIPNRNKSNILILPAEKLSIEYRVFSTFNALLLNNTEEYKHFDDTLEKSVRNSLEKLPAPVKLQVLGPGHKNTNKQLLKLKINIWGRDTDPDRPSRNTHELHLEIRAFLIQDKEKVRLGRFHSKTNLPRSFDLSKMEEILEESVNKTCKPILSKIENFVYDPENWIADP